MTISTAYSRDLGDELRRLRETCTGLTGRALAVQLGWDPSKVSNIEHGKARASEIDLVQLLTVCGKDIDFFEDFRRRYRHAFDLYLAQVPENLRTLAMIESMASKIVTYDALTAPGLLQTRRYARELLIATGVEEPENVEKFVDLRTERQAILRRPYPPKCTFFVHELALQIRLGDDQVMEEQYMRMLFKTHFLRIVPAKFMPVALRSKTTLFEFKKAPPVAYAETDLAKVFAQDGAAVKKAEKLFARLDDIALDEEQSRRKLAEYVSGLRKDPHGSGPDLA
ncbi:helix-turn-helix domain-containing protein [Lentzea sp. PSKA42]|uniref:Helix-turn-helix domain-containing protein n=1 Tax=Lentzea indica TaxID=2604800 RepID=A0ABX1F9W4_9PSEU|nr:helix-turn-helix transcriptional regulator [Lentzea indica]NKE55496.1 helix-turn-helix domain-containing protein [Lentzea indica]